MTKIVLGLALVASVLMADIQWEKSYESALSQATKEKKNVMVMLSKEGCPACEYMKGVVFEDKIVQDTVNQNFVSVYMDVHKNNIPSSLEFMGTPTFYFLNSKGQILKRHDGGAKISKFLQIISSIHK